MGRYFNDELFHYGVLGMKWGIRRYQPYSYTGGSGKEVGLAKELSNLKSNREKLNKKSSLLEKADRHGMVGELLLMLSPYIAGLLVAGAASTAREMEIKKAINFLKKCDKEREKAKTVDKKTGLKVQEKQLSDKENLKRVNPIRRAEKQESYESNNNCVNCTHAYEMRKRGLEAQAKLTVIEGPNGIEHTKSIYKNPVHKKIKGYDELRSNDREVRTEYVLKNRDKARDGKNKELAKETISALKKEPAGSRGQLLINWYNMSGHSLNYVVKENGKVELHDGQTSKIMNESEATKLLSMGLATSYIRLDNLDIKDKKSLHKSVK